MSHAIPTDPIPPAATAAMLAANKGFSVSTENLDSAIAGYTPEQQEVLNFWFVLAKDKGWGLADLAKNTGVSTTVLSRVFRGIYNADVSSVIGTLSRAKANISDKVGNPDFIMTALAKRMFQVFDKTRSLQTVTIMWGPKGIGKTTIEKEYVRQNNHGRTFYLRCPSHGCTLYQFVQCVAKALHISGTRHTVMTLREKIGLYLSRGERLLIVDELHDIFLTCRPREVIRICEFLRELYDISQSGLALTGTEVLHKEFFSGDHREVLAQLVDRGTVQIELPGKPTQKDVLAFLAHYELTLPDKGSEADRLLNDIICANGLRKLTLHLRDGKAYAVKLQEPLAWHHFVAAHEAIQSLSKKSR